MTPGRCESAVIVRARSEIAWRAGQVRTVHAHVTVVCVGGGKSEARVSTVWNRILGNGDVVSMEDAALKIEKYGVDGVLVGRATFGNPWFFSDHQPSDEERLDAVIVHCHVFEKLLPNCAFHNIKKHLAWYCKGFSGARELRMSLMQSHGAMEVEKIIQTFKSQI